MKTGRTLLAIGESILTCVGICFIGFIFYNELPSPYCWVVGILFFLLAIYVSIKVYRMIVRRGYLNTISGDNSSYDLDELKPTPGSGVTQLLPSELEDHFDHENITLKEVTIAIWGDQNGRQLNTKHKISTITYNEAKDIISIYFSDFCELQLRKPSIIHYTSSYIKILNAKEIKWQVLNTAGEKHNFYYLNTGKEIKTKSNSNWVPKQEDLGIGMNALYLQG